MVQYCGGSGCRTATYGSTCAIGSWILRESTVANNGTTREGYRTATKSWVFREYTVANNRTARDVYRTARISITIDNSYSTQLGRGCLAAVEIETTMGFGGSAVAVNYCYGYDIVVVWVGWADGDGLALKVDIAVAGAGVYAGLDFNYIAVVGIIDGCLDVGEICGAIVINGDYSRLAGNGHKEESQTENQLFHLNILQRFP